MVNLLQKSMNVKLTMEGALRYATILLEASHVPATLDTL